MKKTYLTLLLFLIFESSLLAQFKYDFPQFGRETGNFIKQPGNWEGSDWLKAGLVGAGTFLFVAVDKPIRNFALDHPANSKSVPIQFGRIWGEIYSPIIFFSGYAAYSLIANDLGTRKIGYELGQASIYAGVINYVLKVAIGRARPYLNEGPTTFRPFYSLFTEPYHSNPSGHATVAFVISTVLSRNAKPVWLKVLAYVPAALTLVSRVYQDQHWSSDEFLGAAFGYFIASWVVDQHENNSKSLIDISPGLPLSIRVPLN